MVWGEYPDLQAGVELLSEGIAARPSNIALRVSRAEAFIKLGAASRAETDLDEALALDKSDLVLRGAAGLFAELRNCPRAHTLLKRLQIDSSHDPHLVLAVEMAMFSADFEEAARLLTLPTQDHPNWNRLQAMRAMYLVVVDCQGSLKVYHPGSLGSVPLNVKSTLCLVRPERTVNNLLLGLRPRSFLGHWMLPLVVLSPLRTLPRYRWGGTLLSDPGWYNVNRPLTGICRGVRLRLSPRACCPA